MVALWDFSAILTPTIVTDYTHSTSRPLGEEPAVTDPYETIAFDITGRAPAATEESDPFARPRLSASYTSRSVLRSREGPPDPYAVVHVCSCRLWLGNQLLDRLYMTAKCLFFIYP